MPTSAEKLKFLRFGPPPGQGWQRTPNLVYQCARCDAFMPADFNDFFACHCGAMTLDFDAGRFGSHFGDQAIRVYEQIK